MKSVCTDVATSNTRAVRCHEKVVFRSVGEMWRDASDLEIIDTSLNRYDILRSNLHKETEIQKLRFTLMEITSTE